jgi:hypothetical protein
VAIDVLQFEHDEPSGRAVLVDFAAELPNGVRELPAQPAITSEELPPR